MQLTMIRYGLLAGLTFLATIALLRWLATPPGGLTAEAATLGAGIDEQVWHVLAEARRITEESV